MSDVLELLLLPTCVPQRLSVVTHFPSTTSSTLSTAEVACCFPRHSGSSKLNIILQLKSYAGVQKHFGGGGNLMHTI
jgi:hypothetical protein